jgi:hypothetical protein
MSRERCPRGWGGGGGSGSGSRYAVIFFVTASGHITVSLAHAHISSGEGPVKQVQNPVSAPTIHIYAIGDVQVPMCSFEPARPTNEFEDLLYGLWVREHCC